MASATDLPALFWDCDAEDGAPGNGAGLKKRAGIKPGPRKEAAGSEP